MSHNNENNHVPVHKQFMTMFYKVINSVNSKVNLHLWEDSLEFTIALLVIYATASNLYNLTFSYSNLKYLIFMSFYTYMV